MNFYLGLCELLSRLAAEDQHYVLEDLGNLVDKLRLVWGGLRAQALEEGPWDGLGQDLTIVDLGGWDPALLQELLGSGAGDKGAGGQTVSLLCVLEHEGLEGDWVDWRWNGAGDGLDLLQPEGLEGAGDNLLGLGAHQLEVELTVVDNVLDGQARGAGAASNVPEVLQLVNYLYKTSLCTANYLFFRESNLVWGNHLPGRLFIISLKFHHQCHIKKNGGKAHNINIQTFN